MKLITKLLTLFLVSILAIPLTLADTGSNDQGNATVNDNYTIGTSTTIDEPGTSTTVQEDSSADSTPVEQVATPAVNSYVTPSWQQATDAMLNYDLKGQNNSYEGACEIGKNLSETYHWNVDIRELKIKDRKSIYLDVLYPKFNNARGYKAYYGWFGPQKKEVVEFTKGTIYYRDWGISSKGKCKIDGVCSYRIVKSYFGNDTYVQVQPVTEEDLNETAPTVVMEDTPVKNNQSVDNTTQVIENNTIENSTLTQNAGDQENNTNSVNNSKGVIQNQGNGNSFLQYLLDLSHTNWQNVTLSINNYFK